MCSTEFSFWFSVEAKAAAALCKEAIAASFSCEGGLFCCSEDLRRSKQPTTAPVEQQCEQ